MTRVRIFCLAHPRNWVVIKEKNNMIQNLLKINHGSKSWIKQGTKGTRYGIYKQPFILEDEKFVTIPFAWEKFIAGNSTSLEDLIDPTKDKTSEPQPIAIQSELIFDIEEGICYVVDNGIYQVPQERLNEFFKKLSVDTSISISDVRQFSWDKNALLRLEDFAKRDNFTSYVERGKTHYNTITRKGDSDQDSEFLDFKRSVRDGGWITYTYLHNEPDDKWKFSVKGSTISISNSDDNKDRHILLARVLHVRSLLEKTIGGQSVSEYCFSDYR